MSKLRFDAQDLCLDLPAPGFYLAQVKSARFRRSANGNRMLQVVFTVGEVSAAYGRLSEYFVLEGGSAFGLVTTRRRLVGLYFAAGLEPKPGDEINGTDLIGQQLEQGIEESWDECRRRLPSPYTPGSRPSTSRGCAHPLLEEDPSGNQAQGRLARLRHCGERQSGLAGSRWEDTIPRRSVNSHAASALRW
jgi:hypothetical protein